MNCAFSHLLREYSRRIPKALGLWRLKKPYMRYREIDLLSELIQALRPKRCFEWGSGYSTLHFSKYLEPGARWISVDHDHDWHLHVRQMSTSSAVELHHVPANGHPWTDPHGDGAHDDLHDYVTFPSGKGPFNFILIDGRARVPCFHWASRELAEDGVMVLHDANRDYYRNSFNLPQQESFLDYRTTAGGLWVGSPTRKIEELIDLPAHRSLWKTVNSVPFLRI